MSTAVFQVNWVSWSISLLPSPFLEHNLSR